LGRGWTVEIPDWCPPSVNRSRGRHWRVGARLTAECWDFLAAYSAHVPKVRLARRGVPAYLPARRFAVYVYVLGRLPDPENLTKHLLDGAKGARLIVDDSAEWLDAPTPVVLPCGPRGRKTVILVSDL
jgi:hypothetical protein